MLSEHNGGGLQPFNDSNPLSGALRAHEWDKLTDHNSGISAKLFHNSRHVTYFTYFSVVLLGMMGAL